MIRLNFARIKNVEISPFVGEKILEIEKLGRVSIVVLKENHFRSCTLRCYGQELAKLRPRIAKTRIDTGCRWARKNRRNYDRGSERRFIRTIFPRRSVRR